MSRDDPPLRSFVFLQGPPGPLFQLLGKEIRKTGASVYRINLSGGDHYDWPTGGVEYRGHHQDWAAWFDRFLVEHSITDVMLFGDCRPYHESAHRMASDRGLAIHVLEEGYIRPHWMTLEPHGVNGNSTLPRDPAWFLREAEQLPPLESARPITADFRRRARDSYWHYHHTFTNKLRFPHYETHRDGSLLMEAIGWLNRFRTEKQRQRAAEQVMRILPDIPFFLFPLQLSKDFQIRKHSAFDDMPSAMRFVLQSFATHASKQDHLVVKAHPLDGSFYNWPRAIKLLSRKLGIAERVHFLDGGTLEDLVPLSKGMVVVNSTSATFALAEGLPVCALGEAIYKLPGLTHQAHIDSFWKTVTPPDPTLYGAFTRVLLERCLVHGGLASESAVSILIASIMERLFPNYSGQPLLNMDSQSSTRAK